VAVKSVQQINKELSSIYDPQVQSIQQRKTLIPQQLQAEESGLQAKQTQAYDEILGGARRRGLGFSGIPLGEQAKYNSTEYMPALARLRQGAREQEMSLADAIMKINQERFGMANQLQRYSVEDDRWERQFSEDRRRYEQQLAEARRSAAAAARGSGGFSLGGGGFSGGGGTGGSTAIQDAVQRKDKGFAFKDQNGRSVSAAVYARINNIPFRSLLDRMAKLGDPGAKNALGFVGDDFGYNPGKIGNNGNLYDSLVWGSGLKYDPNRPRGGGGGGGGSW